MPQTPPPLSEILAGYGERLALAREALAKSQRALAIELGVSPSRWNHWEKERFPPDIHVMAMFRRQHSVPLDWIYAGDWRLLPTHIAQYIMSRGAAPDAPAAARAVRLAFGRDAGFDPDTGTPRGTEPHQDPFGTAPTPARRAPPGLRRAGPRGTLHEPRGKPPD